MAINQKGNSMPKSASNRILSTPSSYARKHYLYIQEIGTLKSLEPHISKRQNLNSYLFFVVLDGSGYLTYESTRHTIKAGDCAWLDCTGSYSHESSAHDPWRLMWIHFYGSQAKDFYENFLSAGNSFLFRPQNIRPFTAALEQIYQLQEEKSSLRELCSHKYITDIITLCFTDNKNSLPEEYSMGQKLKQVHKHLLENCHQKIYLDDLADSFFISKYYLSRAYKKAYGITIGNTLTAGRISRAKSMLRFSTDSVDSIAVSCGFQDSAYFIKVFKNAENMTPSEYRRKW